MKGIVGVLESVLDKPEVWGDLSLSQEDLDATREFVKDMTRDLSEAEAQLFLDDLDLYDALVQHARKLRAILAAYNPEWNYGMGGRIGYLCNFCGAYINPHTAFNKPAFHEKDCQFAVWLKLELAWVKLELELEIEAAENEI